MSDAKLMDKSKAEPVRRLEVFTGAGQRRRWTASEKAQMVAETFADGASVSAVARRYALRPQQLFAWRRQALRDASRDLNRNGRSGKLAFSPVVLSASPHSETGVVPTIEVVIGTMTVRVNRGADAETLQMVLHAARGVS
jgi:transposase